MRTLLPRIDKVGRLLILRVQRLAKCMILNGFSTFLTVHKETCFFLL